MSTSAIIVAAGDDVDDADDEQLHQGKRIPLFVSNVCDYRMM